MLSGLNKAACARSPHAASRGLDLTRPQQPQSRPGVVGRSVDAQRP